MMRRRECGKGDAGKAVFVMDMLAVGVSVYQPFRTEGANLPRGKGGIDIHNIGGLDLFFHFADAPDFGGKARAPLQGQHQEQFLQSPAMHDAAETQVCPVIRTQSVAVADEGFAAEQVQNRVIRQQRHTRLPTKIPPNQEIAVAPDEEHGNAFVGQFSDFTRNRSIQLGNFVIAHPKIKQIAQNINRPRLPGGGRT